MSTEPVIAFGQQPCGFFPRRFLVAKIRTARRLQAEIGGRVVYFCHDSDHDPRETRTILRHRATGEPAHLNFAVAGKLQRKFAPLYAKCITADWHTRTLGQLPNYVDQPIIDLFRATSAKTVADFCLKMYRGMGLLDRLDVVASSDPEVRRRACDVDDFFVDVPYQGEIVRARSRAGGLYLHEGGDSFIAVAASDFGKEQISPTRDSRLQWMQSVIHCTHYVTGASEQAYLRREDAPEIVYVRREDIERSDEAFTELSG
ncbi:MAG: hypothetical protein E6G64_00095 [Actinobacteria bacterium]|jgi:hypothetical protein|nr:MAG: hypothetical protein E6G64_00095 [Actinomycetota bacterium]